MWGYTPKKKDGAVTMGNREDFSLANYCVNEHCKIFIHFFVKIKLISELEEYPQNGSYNLMAYIDHHGTMNYGHYVA